MSGTQKFQYKLWDAVNLCNSGAIYWNKTGDGVIFNFDKFKKEYLGTNNSFSKSSKLPSFVRQLNLYGFKKASQPWEIARLKGHHEFTNPWFARGRKDLLKYIYRTQPDPKDKAKKIRCREEKDGAIVNYKRKRGRPRRKVNICQDITNLEEFLSPKISHGEHIIKETKIEQNIYNCKGVLEPKSNKIFGNLENIWETKTERQMLSSVTPKNYQEFQNPNIGEKLKLWNSPTKQQRKMEATTIKLLHRKPCTNIGKENAQNPVLKTLPPMTSLLKRPVFLQEFQHMTNPRAERRETCVALKIKQLASCSYADTLDKLDWSQAKVITSNINSASREIVILRTKPFKLSQEHAVRRENSEKEPKIYRSLLDTYKTDCEISDEYLALKEAYLSQTRSHSTNQSCGCQNIKRNTY